MSDETGTVPRTHNLPPGVDALPPALAKLAGITGSLPMESESHIELILRVYERMKGANVWAARVQEITDADTASACKDFRDIIAAELSAIEALRKEEKRPLDEQVKKLQDFFNSVKAYLVGCDDVLRPRLEGWLDKEKARLAAETAEAQRIAREAQERADKLRQEAESTGSVEATVAASLAQGEANIATSVANKTAAAKPIVRGEVSARGTGMRTVWYAEITDPVKALRHYKKDARLLEVLQQIADADARQIKDSGAMVPGVVFKSKQEIAR